MRQVVVDAGPIIHLAQADVLNLLALAGELLVPDAVLEEVDRGSVDLTGLTFTREPVEYERESTYPHLDDGETAALVLCKRRDALLLTDDLEARNAAEDEGFEVHGSIGVVLFAYSRDELSEATAKRTLRDLETETNLYLSAPLIEHAFKRVESDEAGW